ncbi:MAG: RNA polymerase sigma factor [Actinomycetota bacterium]
MEGRPLDDHELVARARDGDADAFGALVARHQRAAFRVAWLIARDPGEAEDAVQEAFVKAWRAMPRFRADAPFRPWILRIVSNEARNRARSARRRDALVLREAAAAGAGDAAPSPEAAALSRDEAEALTRALDRLPERDRMVIAYRWLLDLSEAETAEILGVRLGTVKSRLSRALRRLREELGDGARTEPEARS